MTETLRKFVHKNDEKLSYDTKDELLDLLTKHKFYKYIGDAEINILNDIVNYENKYNEHIKTQHDESKYKCFYKMIEKFFRRGTCCEMWFNMYCATSYKEKIKEMDEFLSKHNYDLYFILDEDRIIGGLVVLTHEFKSDIETIYIKEFAYRNNYYEIGRDLLKCIILTTKYFTHEHMKSTDKIIINLDSNKQYNDPEIVNMLHSLDFKEDS